MPRTLAFCLLLLATAGCSAAAPAGAGARAGMTAADSAARDSAAHRAHANYVRVINSNNTDSLASMLTNDVIFLAANEKPIVGKAAVRAWVDAYYKAFRTSWEKPVQEFVVSGDYPSSDTATRRRTRQSAVARRWSTRDGASSCITRTPTACGG